MKALAEDIEAAVCDAALHWERSDASAQTDGEASAGSASGAYAAVPANKLNSCGAAEHMGIHSRAAAGPAVKRQKQLGDIFDKGKKALAHVESIDLEVDCESDGGSRPASLFRQDNHEDCALMEWLQAHEMHPRCGILFKQIMEWSEIIATPTGRQQRSDIRALARAQGIKMPRQTRYCDKTFRETVRHHFKAAVAQEKLRLTCFQFSISTGASEHGNPQPGDANQAIAIADVADLQSLRQFTRRRADMPSVLKDAVMQVTGGATLNRPAVWRIATSLGMSTQTVIQYPGSEQSQ